MVDTAYEELYTFLRPGVKENECVGLVNKTLYDLGSEHVEGVNAISVNDARRTHTSSATTHSTGDPRSSTSFTLQRLSHCYYRPSRGERLGGST